MDRTKSLLRYSAAFLLLSYGLAKLDGVQFVFSPDQLRQPLGSVSGFWLTWYYYGYSHVYADILGAIQVLASLLFLFERTTLLATMIATPVLTNILLIDIFFRISWVAAGIAAYLLVVFAVFLFESRSALYGLLWRSQPGKPADRALLRWVARALVVGFAVAQAIFQVVRSR